MSEYLERYEVELSPMTWSTSRKFCFAGRTWRSVRSADNRESVSAVDPIVHRTDPSLLVRGKHHSGRLYSDIKNARLSAGHCLLGSIADQWCIWATRFQVRSTVFSAAPLARVVIR